MHLFTTLQPVATSWKITAIRYNFTAIRYNLTTILQLLRQATLSDSIGLDYKNFNLLIGN
jgi:hypothetical protein